MYLPLMLSILFCPDAVVENRTQDWVTIDKKNFKIAERRCQELYEKCLVKFIKKDKQVYYAICGKRNYGRIRIIK